MTDIQEIKKLKFGDNGNDWNKFVPELNLRKEIFKIYINAYPLAKFDNRFMKMHLNLTTQEYIGEYCNGCWNCCMPINELSYESSNVN